MNCRLYIGKLKHCLQYGGFHPKPDVDRFYIPRKDGGKGLIAVEGCLELAVRGL